MSPALAAVTLIAFANGSPDVLSSYAAGTIPGGSLVALGSLYGGFLFCSTLVVSNVIFAVKNPIVLPKIPVLKEVIFYLISVIVIIIFGFVKEVGYTFVCTYFGIYLLYIIISVLADMKKETPPEKDLEN